MNILTVIANNHRQPKLCNMRVRVVAWLKMAVIIKELYENSGNRFEKFNACGNFPKKYSLPYLLGFFLLPVCLFSLSLAI